MTAIAKHPAPYSPSILAAFEEELRRDAEYRDSYRILDPFAGIGRIHDLAERNPGWDTVGIELEHEWACAHERTVVGDATSLPFPDESFDAIAVSPAYGNRMADKYDGRGRCRKCSGAGGECQRCNGTGVDQSSRRTYRIFLGRMPSRNSTTVLQWGPAYRSLHEKTWAETVRVLKEDSIFLLNSKDHERKGDRQYVTDWHVECLEALGLAVMRRYVVETPGFRHGQNHDARFDEEVVALVKASTQ